MQSGFAFDIIVLNFPYGTAAQSSALHITELQQLWHIPSEVTVLVTSDPSVNMGSGGDTIAALSHVMQENGRKKSILIIHAVGDSNHCWNEVVFGKPWNFLPNTLGTTLNPIAVSVHCLSKFYCNVPHGSVMVVSIDAMPSLSSCPEVSTEIGSSMDVLKVGFSVPLDTMWNHCAYVFSDESEALQLPQKVFQKPTRDTDHELHSAILDDDQPDTWIDTGIVVFLPNAVKLLLELSMGPLKLYTEKCIQSFLQTHDQEEPRQPIPPLDIYAHILQAINCTYPSEYLTFYPEPVFKDLFHTLSTLNLSIVTLPQGQFQFQFLATAHEVIDFIAQSDLETYRLFISHDESSSEPVYRKQRRCHTFLPFPIVHANSTSRVYNTLVEIPPSAVQETASIVLQDNAVMENCHLLPMAKMQIQPNSFLNCVRGIISQDFTLPSNMLLQQVAHDDGFVFIALGIDDEVKKLTTVHNIPFWEFMQCTALLPYDLWNDGDEQNIWNARLHPIIPTATDCDLPRLNLTPLHGISEFFVTKNISCSSSFLEWKNSERLSLSQIQSFCQNKIISDNENNFRHELQHAIPIYLQQHEQNLSSTLLERKPYPCFLLNAPENTQNCWNVVDNVLLESLQKEQFDITSRCFMIHQNWVLDILTLNGMREQKYASFRSLMDSCSDFFKSLYGPIQHKKNSIPTSSNFEQYCKDLIFLRDQCLALTSSGESKEVISSTLSSLIAVLQETAALLTKACVGNTFHFSKTQSLPKMYEWVVASAPARIDIAGGWTDTPPISYEYGGAVCNLSVTIDQKKPFIAKCHKTTTFSGIKIITQGLTFSSEVHIHIVWDLLSDYYDLFSGKATLVKSALICLGLIPASYLHDHDKNDEASMKRTSIQHLLETFLSTEKCGLEIVTMSNLPQGSGMGGSSILGGCILAAIGRIIGLDTDEFESDEEHSLLHAVLALEQIMTSGGGWQDQVGGIMPGFKITKSVRNVISPLELQIESIPIPPQLHDDLRERMALVFTGKQRVAKNILQNVLRRWSRRSNDIMQTVKDLIKGAESAAEAFRGSDIDGWGRCIKEYWEQKKIMTGGGEVEPPNVKKALDVLYEKKEIVGGTLCGAGGGGFLLLLAREGRKGMDLQKVLEEDESYARDFQSFTWHECIPQSKGLSVQIFQHNLCCHRASAMF